MLTLHHYDVISLLFLYFSNLEKYWIVITLLLNKSRSCFNRIKSTKMISNLWTEITLLRTNYPILSPAILVFVGLQIYYRIVVVKPVELHCKKNSLYHVSLNKSIRYQIKFFLLHVEWIHYLRMLIYYSFFIFRNF